MLERLLDILHVPWPGWIDLLDILVLSFLIYQLLLLIRGTRAVHWITGFLLIALAYWFSGLSDDLELNTVHRLLGYVLFYIPFAVIVIFQNTIRRALSRFGRNPLLRLMGQRTVGIPFIDEICLAATTLASRRIGGLIILEREQGLREHAETGIELDAKASYDLIINIFAPHTPLHDGAIILREERIVAASCFLPLTANPYVSKSFGTRHRAGIGITEDTDAVAIVISEETGEVSVAAGGRLRQNLSGEQLRDVLVRALGPAEPEEEAREKQEQVAAPVEQADET